jgi:YHS domain-containing protein
MKQKIRELQSMPQNEDSLRDPVCGMQVAPDQHSITHQQMHFAFCSTQCKERFLANSHLYIVHPGNKAPAQEGRTVLKHRRLKLDESLPDDLAQLAITYIKDMMGIEHIKVEGDTINIQYDLLQVTEAQIESALVEVGATLSHSWSERLPRAFVHYFEETEIAILEVPPGAGGHHH